MSIVHAKLTDVAGLAHCRPKRSFADAVFAKRGQQVTCRNCTAIVQRDQVTGFKVNPEGDLIYEGPATADAAMLSARMVSRQYKTRVVRMLSHHTGDGEPCARLVVLFKGSEAAFRRWSATNQLKAGDVVEQCRTDQRDADHVWANAGFPDIGVVCTQAFLKSHETPAVLSSGADRARSWE